VLDHRFAAFVFAQVASVGCWVNVVTVVSLSARGMVLAEVDKARKSACADGRLDDLDIAMIPLLKIRGPGWQKLMQRLASPDWGAVPFCGGSGGVKQ
jgi:hypothetical protein